MSESGDGTRVVLSADEVVAGYLPGIDILNGCSVEVHEGEVVGVIGPNGAGKSTLVKSIFGLVPVRRGSVHLNGNDVTQKPAHALVAAGLGYVPQLDNVFPRLTVTENLEVGCYLAPRTFRARVEYVLELFPRLTDRRSQRAGSLSGGERQMVGMGRALMMEPSVLLLDEPSAGLSPIIQAQVFEQVERINAAGVAVLMVEQNARRCLQICHRGYVLDQGRNVYTDKGDRLLHDPKVIELYLGTLAGSHHP
jgi:branched-chain amino acid transport system ATP-binding protein